MMHRAEMPYSKGHSFFFIKKIILYEKAKNVLLSYLETKGDNSIRILKIKISLAMATIYY